MPALASIVFLVKVGALEGFAVLSGFLVLLAVAVYGIGERLEGPRLGALAAGVAVTLPGVFLYSREFIFALPTATLLACAVYCLLRSDGLLVRRWAIACGVALGLMLLTRSMAITYVPGVLAAGLVCILARRHGDLSKRLLNMSLLILTGTALAATWYVPNFTAIYDYLTGFGYGKQSKYYGNSDSLLSWERLRAVPTTLTREDLLLPLAAVLLVGLLTVAVVAVRRTLRSPDRRATVLRLASTDAMSVLIVFAAGFAALTSSRNGGSGFTLPIAVLIPAMAILALRVYPGAIRPVVTILVAIAAFNALAYSTVWSAASAERNVSVPGFDELPVAYGIPKAVFGIRLQIPGPETRFGGNDRDWPDVDRELAQQFIEWKTPNGALPVVATGVRNRALNPNTIQLAAVLNYKTSIPFVWLSAEPKDSVARYSEQLSDNSEIGIPPSVLLTTDTEVDDFPPAVSQAYVETAARGLGFRLVRTIPLPDGRILRIWRRQSA